MRKNIYNVAEFGFGLFGGAIGAAAIATAASLASVGSIVWYPFIAAGAVCVAAAVGMAVSIHAIAVRALKFDKDVVPAAEEVPEKAKNSASFDCTDYDCGTRMSLSGLFTGMAATCMAALFMLQLDLSRALTVSFELAQADIPQSQQTQMQWRANLQGLTVL